MKTTRQIQALSTGFSLVVLALGFSLIGYLSFVYRPYDTGAMSSSLDNDFRVAGGGLSLVVGSTFLIAALIYWNCYAKRRVIYL
jgi:hypothetical protein